jgi:hypothetical protein
MMEMKDREKLKEKIVDILMQFWTDDEPDYDRTHRYAELILMEIEKTLPNMLNRVLVLSYGRLLS